VHQNCPEGVLVVKSPILFGSFLFKAPLYCYTYKVSPLLHTLKDSLVQALKIIITTLLHQCFFSIFSRFFKVPIHFLRNQNLMVEDLSKQPFNGLLCYL